MSRAFECRRCGFSGTTRSLARSYRCPECGNIIDTLEKYQIPKDVVRRCVYGDEPKR